MTDKITIDKAVVEQALDVLAAVYDCNATEEEVSEAMELLRSALSKNSAHVSELLMNDGNYRRKALQEQPQQELVAWMFQHDETGRTLFVDTLEVEQGFEEGNPRWKKIGPVYTHPEPQPCWPYLSPKLRAVLEQSQQEPDVVEFRQFLTDVHTAAGLIAHGKQSKALSERLAEAVVKYRTQKQEPVAWMMVNPAHLPSSRSLHWEPQNWHITWQAVPLYTAPPAPRRLTFQEIDEVCKSVDPGEIEWLWSDLVKFARAIEARILGSKT